MNGLTDSEGERSPSKARTPKAKKRLSRRERECEEELRERLKREIEIEIRSLGESRTEVLASRTDDETAVQSLKAEDLAALASNNEFLSFVERSSKVAERRLDQEYDILADYALAGLGEVSDDDEHLRMSEGKKSHSIKEIAQFYDERWSKKRMISDVNFSPKV